ncbi:MAG: hypothetical protein D6760_05530 [Deltaproteobacteria bacterium]|nr:MAG: hypothetical protein D6760_05530 [Deltaproteobacteria bacterium]
MCFSIKKRLRMHRCVSARWAFRAVVLVVAMSSSALGATVIGGFTKPVAIALDGQGYAYVADEAGYVRKVDLAAPAIVAALGSPGSGDGQFDQPHDVALDGNGDLVVVDRGNNRLVVMTTAGQFVRNVPLAGKQPLRVSKWTDGSLLVLEFAPGDLLYVERFDTSYHSLGSWVASQPCSLRSMPSFEADMAIDAAGAIWVAEHLGCGEEYRLRKYSVDGALQGNWSRVAGQLSPETLANAHYAVGLIADLFTAGNEVYVILGAGGAESGGLEVDVWTTSGQYERRSALVGPARPWVRAVADSGWLYIVDPGGTNNLIKLQLSALQ